MKMVLKMVRTEDSALRMAVETIRNTCRSWKRGMLFLVAILIVSWVVALFSVSVYHACRVRRHRQYLKACTPAGMTRTEVESVLGTPFRVLPREDAVIWCSYYKSNSRDIERVRRYPLTLVYFRGDIVYFLHINADDKLGEFSCLRN